MYDHGTPQSMGTSGQTYRARRRWRGTAGLALTHQWLRDTQSGGANCARFFIFWLPALFVPLTV